FFDLLFSFFFFFSSRRRHTRFSRDWSSDVCSSDLGVLYPNQTVLMNFLFPIKAKYMVMIYAAIELVMTFQPNQGISTIAHLGGRSEERRVGKECRARRRREQ